MKDREVTLSKFHGRIWEVGDFVLAMARMKISDFSTSIVVLLMLSMPLAYVRSDAINVNDGKIWNLGNWGNGWSRTANSSTNAYNLAFNPTEVYPSNNNNRWNGRPLRCRTFAGFGADLKILPSTRREYMECG